ncbi:MAG: transketolase [Chlorobia bacterium]|nr:transketolase [Fimbriimonadaceae bacterium]
MVSARRPLSLDQSRSKQDANNKGAHAGKIPVHAQWTGLEANSVRVGGYPEQVSATISTDIQTLCINTIRGLAMDGVQKANSGHPGLPMGCAPMAYALWTKHLKHNPKNPAWFDRDRFILSAGHGSMLLYSLLHLTGYDLGIEDLKQFRQLNSRTPGHPENHLTPGVEMATGPLGQGFATSVGFAIAEKFLAASYNKPGYEIIDHFTYGICSDGDLMEGVTSEAASLAGHLKLGKLIFLYDDNKISIDGSTEITFTENVEARFKAYGWHTQRIDGMDVEAVDQALDAAKADDRPSLILARTTIGYGSPNKAGTSKVHGAALGSDEVKLTKEALGIQLEPEFYVPDDALVKFRSAVGKGEKAESEWSQRFDAYASAYPQEGAKLKSLIAGDLGTEWLDALPKITETIATRKSGEKVLEAIQDYLPTLIGGAADLVESTFTHQKNSPDFQPETPNGKNINFGVREHAMVAAANGITLHGGTRGFGSSFFIFTDYCRPSIRLAALMECPTILVFTHDSIGLGEDGPTHQPIEHLASFRAMPNFNLIRPCDGNETSSAWKVALQSTKTPTLLVLSRQNLPALTSEDVKNHPLEKGAYILKEAAGGSPRIILVGTGSEVQHCWKAAVTLESEGISTRVVSMPSWHLFEQQSESYRNSVLPKGTPTLSVEAGSVFGWTKYATDSIGIDRFGVSAPSAVAMAEFGFTPENVVARAKKLL